MINKEDALLLMDKGLTNNSGKITIDLFLHNNLDKLTDAAIKERANRGLDCIMMSDLLNRIYGAVNDKGVDEINFKVTTYTMLIKEMIAAGYDLIVDEYVDDNIKLSDEQSLNEIKFAW